MKNMKNKSLYTIIYPKDVRKYNLPCKIYCIFAGDLQKQKTIFFENPNDKKLLTMTVSDEPELIESREECYLSDKQIEDLKHFIRQEKMMIVLHYRGVLEKKDFIRAVKGKTRFNHRVYLWIRNFDVYEGHNPIKLIFRWFAWKMWDYHEARCLNRVFKNKKQTPANSCSFLRYLILSLFFEDEEL